MKKVRKTKAPFLRSFFVAASACDSFNIVVDNRILIHQESLPGQADITGFKTKPQAEAMAKLVMQKLKKSAGMPSGTAKDVEEIE